MSAAPATPPRWLHLLELLACTALLFMLAVTMADVLGRYIVGRPVKGVTELVQYAMVVTVFCGLPAVTARRQHISIGLLDKALTGTADRLRLGLVGLASAGILAAQAWVLFEHAQGMREAADVIGSLRLPVHPAGYLMAALSALAAVVCVLAALRPGTPAPSQGTGH